MEKNILYQKEKEALLYQKSQNEKKKVCNIFLFLFFEKFLNFYFKLINIFVQQLLKNLIVDQQKLDEEISRFFTQKEQEQNKFIQQLQFGKLIENDSLLVFRIYETIIVQKNDENSLKKLIYTKMINII